MRFRSTTAILVLALTLSCASRPASESEPVREDLSHDEAASLIRDHVDFRKPIVVEIPADSRGPAAGTLAERGYLEIPDTAEGNTALTAKAEDAGAYEGWFESNIPLYYIPVGKYELERVDAIEEMSRSAGTKIVDFVYRHSINPLGDELQAASATLQPLAAGGPGLGRALVVRSDGAWEVKLLELRGAGSARL